jgi:hypothetical protein
MGGRGECIAQVGLWIGAVGGGRGGRGGGGRSLRGVSAFLPRVRERGVEGCVEGVTAVRSRWNEVIVTRACDARRRLEVIRMWYVGGWHPNNRRGKLTSVLSV